jgi:hypothetical protein
MPALPGAPSNNKRSPEEAMRKIIGQTDFIRKNKMIPFQTPDHQTIPSALIFFALKIWRFRDFPMLFPEH